MAAPTLAINCPATVNKGTTLSGMLTVSNTSGASITVKSATITWSKTEEHSSGPSVGTVFMPFVGSGAGAGVSTGLVAVNSGSASVPFSIYGQTGTLRAQAITSDGTNPTATKSITGQ